MRFRYIDIAGREHYLADVPALAAAIRDGTVRPATMLYDSEDPRWAASASHDVFAALTAATPQTEYAPPSLNSSSTDSPYRAENADSLSVGAQTEVHPHDQATITVAFESPPDTDRPTPVVAPRRPAVARRYQNWALLLVATVLAGFGTTAGVTVPFRIGEAAGQLILSGLIGLALFGWTKAHKHYALATMVAILVLATVGRIYARIRDKAEVTEELRSVVDAADSAQHFASVTTPVTAAPISTEARVLRVLRATMASYQQHFANLQARYGADVVPPAEWLTPEYLASPTAYPHVIAYWNNYAEYVADLSSSFESVSQRILNEELRTAGISAPSLRDNANRGLQAGLNRTGPFIDVLESYVGECKTLHTYLVAVDERSYLDTAAGVARFEVDSELTRVQATINRIQALEGMLQQELAASQVRTNQFLDSLRSALF